jgi:hypothetical protein
MLVLLVFISCSQDKSFNYYDTGLNIEHTYEPMKYGFFVHYVPRLTVYPNGERCDDLNELAKKFDAQAFAEDLKAMQVEYVIFTAWHGYMNLLYPSEKMNQWLPGHSANHDMIGEMVRAVKDKDIKVYLYTHPRVGHSFRIDAEKEATGWGSGINPVKKFNPNWATFDFAKWNHFINDIYAELVDRYGDEIDGIWIDEGSPAGDSYRVVDYERLRKTIKTRNPNLTMINNFYGTLYSCDIGMREYGPGWGEFGQPDGAKWPSYTIPVGATFAGKWLATNPKQINPVQFSASDMFRYVVLQAGVNTCGGGVAWAAGPYAGGGWETGVLDTMIKVGEFIEPIAQSIKQTLPSASYPTLAGKTINDLGWGVATRSLDNQYEYLHVLKAPESNKLILPAPKDGKIFQSAKLLKNGETVSIEQNPEGVVLVLPENQKWDVVNTVIQLSLSGFSPVETVCEFINNCDYDKISYEGKGWHYNFWDRWNFGDYNHDVQQTGTKGDQVLLAFTGTGVEYISGLSEKQGKCDIFLDGVYQTTVNAFSDGYQAQQVLFRKVGLDYGRHVLKIVNSEDKLLMVDVFKVYKK